MAQVAPLSVSESADLLGVDVAVRRADYLFKASIKVRRSGCFQQFVDASFTPGRDFFIECVEHLLGKLRLPSFSGHPICTDLVSVREDVHCESTAQEVHA